MTRTEFENRINEQVTDAAFDFANRIYMAAYTVGKDDFCEDWKNHNLNCNTVSALTMEVENGQSAIKNLETEVRRQEERFEDFSNRMLDFLVLQAEKWSASDLRDKAIELVGFRKYLRTRIELGLGITWQKDIDELAKMLDNE